MCSLKRNCTHEKRIRRPSNPDLRSDPPRPVPATTLPAPRVRHANLGGRESGGEVRVLQSRKRGPESDGGVGDHASQRHHHPELHREHEQGQNVDVLHEPPRDVQRHERCGALPSLPLRDESG